MNNNNNNRKQEELGPKRRKEITHWKIYMFGWEGGKKKNLKKNPKKIKEPEMHLSRGTSMVWWWWWWWCVCLLSLPLTSTERVPIFKTLASRVVSGWVSEWVNSRGVCTWARRRKKLQWIWRKKTLFSVRDSHPICLAFHCSSTAASSNRAVLRRRWPWAGE